MIGETSDVDEYKFLAEENDIYGDILNSNAPDTYVGLPQKVKHDFFKLYTSICFTKFCFKQILTF